MRRLVFFVAVLLACTSCAVRGKGVAGPVVSFDESVASAATAHDAMLDDVLWFEEDEYRDRLASARLPLTLSPECDALPAGGASPAAAKECRVTPRGGKVSYDPTDVTRLRALAKGLARYSSSLKALATSGEADRAEYQAALAGAASALAKLNDEAGKAGLATGAESRHVGMSGRVFGFAADAYLGAKRRKALADVLAAADPAVAKAADVLAKSYGSAATLALSKRQYTALLEAERALDRRLKDVKAPVEEIRAAQDAVFNARRDYVDSYVATARQKEAFLRIAEAHRALVAASAEKPSEADHRNLSDALHSLSDTVDSAMNAFSGAF
jgi:hypothetical protein